MDNVLLQAVRQESFLHLLREEIMKREADLEGAEEILLDREVMLELEQGRKKTLAEEIQALERKLISSQESVKQAREMYQRLQTEKNILLDFQALFSGHGFRGGAEGSRFFTHTIADFASHQGFGELMVEDALKTSSDMRTFRLKDQEFWFLQGADGNYYIHPETISSSGP